MKLTKLIPICLAITLSMKWPAITSNLFDPKLELALEKPTQPDYGRFFVNKSRTKIPLEELKNQGQYSDNAVESFAAQAGDWIYFITQGYSIFRMSSDGQKTELFLIEEMEAGNHKPFRPSIQDLHIWDSYLYFLNSSRLMRINLDGGHLIEVYDDYTGGGYCVVDDFIFMNLSNGFVKGDLEGKEWKLIWERPEYTNGTDYALVAAGNNRVLVWESNRDKADILWQIDYNGENRKKVYEFPEIDMEKSGAQLSQDVLYLLRERAYEYTERALRAEWPSEIEEKEQLRKQRSKMEDSIIEAIDLKTGNYQKLLGVWDTEIRDIAVRGENIYYQQRVKIYKSDDIYDYDVRKQIWKLDKNGRIHFVTDVIKAGVNYYATDRYLITNEDWLGDADTSSQKSAVIRITVEGKITQPQPEYYKWEYADEIWKDGFPQWVPWSEK